MQKAHSNIDWVNYPSMDTPINETNLNKMDRSIDTIDDRVVTMDTTKADVTVVNGLVKSITLDDTTGVFTITYQNGSTSTIDTLLEKLAINFDYDATTQKLIIYLSDGTTKEVDLSALITQNEFDDTDTIGFTVTNGVVKANVLDGSITESKLQPNYLAECKSARDSAQTSESNASASKVLAESYAKGGTGTRAGEDTDNAKYYMERASQIAKVDIATTTTAGIVKPDGTTITIASDGTISSVGGSAVASNVSYDNTNSGLEATNVQSAIDDLQIEIDNLQNDVDEINDTLSNLITTTIASGETSATITDEKITTTSIVDVYFKDKVLAPTNLVVTEGQIVLEIDAEETDTEIGIRVI